MRYPRSLLLFLLQLHIAVVAAHCLRTESTAAAGLPVDFERISAMEQITEDCVFLLGARPAQSAARSSLILLTDQKNSSWLLGTDIGSVDDSEKSIAVEDARHKWYFEKIDNDGFVVRSAESGLYVKAADANKTHLTLTTDVGTAWRVECRDGYFYFIHPDNETRRLSLYKLEGYRFGNYANGDEDAFCIYRACSSEGEVGRDLPVDGASVAIVAQQFAASQAFSPVDVTGLFLQDGSMAQEAVVGQWICQHRGNGTFALCTVTENDTLCLSYDFRLVAKEQLWQMVDGALATCEATVRYLYYDEGFRLEAVETGTATVDLANSARLITFASEPTSQLSGGLLTLTGGWSTERLADVSWDGVDGLDLSALSLPVVVQDFLHRPEGNTVIYVGLSAADHLPESWPFVVVYDAGTARLLTATKLKDKCALRLACDVHYEANMLSYERAAYTDGAWETLCLPFTCAVPEDFEAVALSSAGADTLQFEIVERVKAYEPLLIRRKGEMTAEESFRLILVAGESGVLAAHGMGDGGNDVFRGAMEWLEVGQEHSWFLLTPDGKSFARAATGSGVPPFRAYLQLEGTIGQSNLRVRRR